MTGADPRDAARTGETVHLEGAELCAALAWTAAPPPPPAEGDEPAAPEPVRVRLEGACRVARDLDLPAHVSLELAPGARLAVAPGRTLVVRGGFRAGADEALFPGPGRVRFGSGAAVRLLPRWWGATGDGAADDAPALQAMLDALPPSGGRAAVPAGAYRLGRTLRVEDRAGWEVALDPEAELRPARGLAALEVLRCARWMLREPRVRMAAGAPCALRVAGGASRGLLHRPRVEAAGRAAPGAAAIRVEEGARWTEVREPRVGLARVGAAGRLAAGVRFAGASDGARVVGGEVRDCAAGVVVDDCDDAAVDGTSFVDVETGIVLSASPARPARAPFRAISARFERVACAVDVRSVPGVGTVHPPLLSDLRFPPATVPVRCVPGAAVRLIAPVRLAAAGGDPPPPGAPQARRPLPRPSWGRSPGARPRAPRGARGP